MIVKKILKPKGIKGSFEGVAKYILDTKNNGEKCEVTTFTNFSFGDDYKLNFKEASSLQEICNFKKNPTYHFVISFDNSDKVDYKLFSKIEKEFILALGFSDCQRLSVIHNNTNNIHLHVVVNRVHPYTFKIVKEPFFDTNILQNKAIEIERQHKLKQTKHTTYNKTTGDVPKSINDKEIHSGVLSFLSWIKNELQQNIQNIFRDDKSTIDDIHVLFARYNLELRLRGNGFVVSDKTRKLFVKASDVDKSISKNALERRYGVLNLQQSYDVPILKRYGQKNNALWEEYIMLKNNEKSAKNQARNKEKEERLKDYAKLKDYYKNRRQSVKDNYQLEKKTKFIAYKILSKEYIEDRNKIYTKYASCRDTIYSRYKSVSYIDFLRNKAQNGDSKAINILLKKQQYDSNANINSIIAVNGKEVKLALDVCITKSGQIYYMINDQKVFDSGNAIQVFSKCTKITISAMLDIAYNKFGMKPVTISGTKEFKQYIIDNNNGKLNIIAKSQNMEV
ncbi:MAG: relaxase/mobilization nuclease domain-containing protein [Endomicrobium sp.]|jgi:hypothetical protein|nr:relaxase/mobilization nuclease domain-containing protein [Endomicrobium sp.]